MVRCVEPVQGVGWGGGGNSFCIWITDSLSGVSQTLKKQLCFSSSPPHPPFPMLWASVYFVLCILSLASSTCILLLSDLFAVVCGARTVPKQRCRKRRDP